MVRNSEEAPVLVAQTGPLNGQRWPLRGEITIGRDSGCEIVVPDRQVSRHHARITSLSEGVFLEDLDSKNGTHYNGHTVSGPQVLQDGDVIQIALAQQFVFLGSDATVPLDSDDVDLLSFPAKPSNTPRLRLEKRSRRVWIGDHEVLPPLSVSQFRLLERLYENEGRVVSRQDLIAAVWGKEQAVEVSEQALDALVRRLRDRLANVDPSHVYVVTVRGHGLRLDNPSEQ